MDEKDKRAPAQAPGEAAGSPPQERGVGQGEGPQAPAPDARSAKERFYDKIPLNFRQVDTLVKVLLALLAAALVAGIWQGQGG